MKKGDKLYYARIIPNISYDVYELKVRMVTDEWFSATEKINRNAFLFGYNALNNTVFENRQDALNKIKEAENNKKQVNNKDYEESLAWMLAHRN